MQPSIVQFGLRGARWCGSGLVTLLFWTLWLFLGLLAAGQAYIATTRELELPGFAVREIEARLAASGMHATFGRTFFDPSGRVLVEDARLTIAPFDEPVVTADAIYARVHPWALIADRFEPIEVRMTGLSIRVPSMLSSSGRNEEVIRDLDTGFSPDGPDIRFEYLTCRVGNLTVSARGPLRLGGSRPGRAAPLPLAEFLARKYAKLTGTVGAAIERLGSLEDPELRVVLTTADPGGPAADLSLLARGIRLTAPLDIQATDIQADTRVAIGSAGALPIEFNVAAGNATLPMGTAGGGIRARVRAVIGADHRHLHLDLVDVDATAGSAAFRGVGFAAPFASLEPGPLPRIRVESCALLRGLPLSVGVDADLAARTAYLRVDGSLAPGLIDLVSARLGRDLRKFANPGAPIEISGGVQLGPGWKFARATARVSTRDLRVRAVAFDDLRARIDFDGHRLSAPEASVRSGENFASGTYTQDVATNDYRFLVEGGMRPMAIASWFPQWWAALFGNFAFPDSVPRASVDMRGRWKYEPNNAAFVQVDSRRPVVRGTVLDRARTILFVRPAFADGIEIRAERGDGSATATFSRTIDPGPAGMQHVVFEATSSLDPRDDAGILGVPGAVSAAHLVCGRPPVVTVAGSADLPKKPGGPNRAVRFKLRSEGPFTLYNWPLDHVALGVDLRGDDLRIEPVSAAFAGGAAAGRLEIKGAGPARRVSFTATCSNGNLGQAIVAAESFLAQRKGSRPRSASTFLGDRSSVRFNLGVSAEGRFGDPYSYHGQGEASLDGKELGEVRMLGLLSELLKFTALRFTSARGDFKIEGRRLEFPNIKVTGANSNIEAHGTYSLDRHELDVKAKIFPFGQSKLLPEMLVGAVLAPLSDVFEMRLTGSVEKPSWNLAKVGAQPAPATAAKPAPAAPAAP